MKHIVSFSGGRTSAYLVHLMEQKRKNEGWDVEYVFMDTGAEHPKTHEFVRLVEKHYSMNVAVLKIIVNPTLGQKNNYEVCTSRELEWDLQRFKDLVAKYGNPYNPSGGFCTDQLKTKVYQQYIGDLVNLIFDDVTSWLGMRHDEPKRLWGEKCYFMLKKHGYSNNEIVDIFTNHKNVFLTKEAKQLIQRRREFTSKQNFKYLAEISDYTKADILDFWQSMPFDLEVPEFSGNCIFCIKKSPARIALAQKESPEFFEDWNNMIKTANPKGREFQVDAIYRGKLTFEGIASFYKNYSYEEIKQTLRREKGLDTGCGSESCEAFSQIDMFEEVRL